ncbi:MAG: UDP-N-acetylenolpyruvoylglucosamine reductase [Parcubacteria group bacterium GW2011_GWA2_49_9]|nr:MAG: UDP-N-acetylenolpyruvoylglucosamine reductase [Parcubacteria group bacterium GW2011_GWA2_49_9]
MHIQEHISLKELTTMKIGGDARYFCSASTAEALAEAVLFAREKNVPVIVLGGGSNTLVASGDINALVLKIEIKGVEWESPLGKWNSRRRGALRRGVGGGLLQPPAHRNASTPFSKGDSVPVVVGAGESWDGFVAQAVEKGLWGIENLSGIPGTVGAAPIQNIGAYGTEVKDTILWVEVFDIKAGKLRRLTNAECRFAYRDSMFKHQVEGPFIVCRVAFLLRKDGVPNLEYKDLQKYFGNLSSPPFQGEKRILGASQDLERPSSDAKGVQLRYEGDKRGGSFPSLQQIRNAVIEIRSGKFPDLREFGTAGSFFKNPIISKKQFDELKERYPNLPGFPLSLSPSLEGEIERWCTPPTLPSKEGRREEKVKIPLAWVLDNICNLKGFKKGNVALFEKQPIVLVHSGEATSEEIELFAKEIADIVKVKTGIEIEWEVQRIF